MNARYSKIFKNVSYTVIANAIGFIVSALAVLIVPKFIDATQYGYFQLYIFYAGYIGFVNFGWPEGILLRYGGAHYRSLDKSAFKTQFVEFSALSCLVGLGFLIPAMLQTTPEKGIVFLTVGICIIVYLPRAFFNVLLQMTNRASEYSIGIIIEKTVYSIGIVALLASGYR